MEEYEEYANGADIFHQKEVEMEEWAAQCTPVGELVAHYLVRHKPADEDTGKETYDGQEDLPGNEVKPIEQRASCNAEEVDGAQ